MKKWVKKLTAPKTEKVESFFWFPTRWLVTYQLKLTHEICSDTVINFTDDPRDVLEYIARNFFDDQEADLISITRL